MLLIGWFGKVKMLKMLEENKNEIYWGIRLSKFYNLLASKKKQRKIKTKKLRTKETTDMFKRTLKKL